MSYPGHESSANPNEPAPFTPTPPPFAPTPAPFAPVASTPPAHALPESEPATPAHAAPTNGSPIFAPVQPAAAEPFYAPTPSAPPAFAYQPVPAPPTYDPTVMQPPFSAPPVSAPYGYIPMASAIPAPPQKRGRVGIVILSVLTTLLLLGAGVMTTLFLQQKGEVDKANTQITTLNGTVTSQQDKISTMEKDLDNTKRDLTDAKADAEEMATQKKAVADCVNAIYAFWREIDKSGPNSSATDKKGKALDTACHNADKYL
jgi:hypothetical protein